MRSLNWALPMLLLALGAQRLEALQSGQTVLVPADSVNCFNRSSWGLCQNYAVPKPKPDTIRVLDTSAMAMAVDHAIADTRAEMMSKAVSAAPPDATEVKTISSATPLKHAPTRHAFTCGPVSQEVLARAVMSGKDGDRKVLCHIKASTFVSAMNETYNLRLENREDLARWIRAARVVRCPAGPTRLLRTKNDGTVDFKGWVRDLHPDEMCLENNGNFVSLWCGNPAPDLRLAEVPRPSKGLLGMPVPASVVRQPEVPRIYTAPPPVIIQEKKKGNILKPIGIGLAVAGIGCLISHTITWDGPCGHHSPPPLNVDVNNHIIIQAGLYSGGLTFSHPWR